jgi:hypothetical protein
MGWLQGITCNVSPLHPPFRQAVGARLAESSCAMQPGSKSPVGRQNDLRLRPAHEVNSGVSPIGMGRPNLMSGSVAATGPAPVPRFDETRRSRANTLKPWNACLLSLFFEILQPEASAPSTPCGTRRVMPVRMHRAGSKAPTGYLLRLSGRRSARHAPPQSACRPWRRSA